MRAWKIVSGGLFLVILILIAVMLWQNQLVKKELLRDYILQHASVDQSLEVSINAYEESGDAVKFADDLIIAYGAAVATTRKPAEIDQVNGIPYLNNVEYLSELKDMFNFYLPAGMMAAIEDARDGELTEEQYRNLQGYHELIQEFMELTVTEDFGDKSVADFEADFKTFYEKNETRISELINN